MTSRQRNLRGAWEALAISSASLTNLFTHQRYSFLTVPLTFIAFAYMLYIDLKR